VVGGDRLYEREIAGGFVGVAALALILKGHVSEAMYLLLPTLGFFIGEKNGERKAANQA